MPEKERLIAACGLDCTDCDMRQAATNPETQRKFAIWFNVPSSRALRSSGAERPVRASPRPAQDVAVACWLRQG